MKPEMLCTAPMSPMISQEEAFESLPPVSAVLKKREREQREDHAVDSSKEMKPPRLPSIKHLQLDLVFPPQAFTCDNFPFKHIVDNQGQQQPRPSYNTPKQQQPTQTQFQYINITPNQPTNNKVTPQSTPPTTPTSAKVPTRPNFNSQTPPQQAQQIPQVNSGVSSPTPGQEVLVPVVTNNFGFIETTFANVPVKKTHRRRPANVDKSSLYCHNCGAKNTPEWRRGPMGPATLCNACGLAYAKRLRQEEDTQSQVQVQFAACHDPMAMGVPMVINQCGCTQAAMYGRCVHTQQSSDHSVKVPMAAQPMIKAPSQVNSQGVSRVTSHTFHHYTPPTQTTPGNFNNSMVFY